MVGRAKRLMLIVGVAALVRRHEFVPGHRAQRGHDPGIQFLLAEHARRLPDVTLDDLHQSSPLGGGVVAGIGRRRRERQARQQRAVQQASGNGNHVPSMASGGRSGSPDRSRRVSTLTCN